jgi:hypothetical protein
VALADEFIPLFVSRILPWSAAQMPATIVASEAHSSFLRCPLATVIVLSLKWLPFLHESLAQPRFRASTQGRRGFGSVSIRRRSCHEIHSRLVGCGNLGNITSRFLCSWTCEKGHLKSQVEASLLPALGYLYQAVSVMREALLPPATRECYEHLATLRCNVLAMLWNVVVVVAVKVQALLLSGCSRLYMIPFSFEKEMTTLWMLGRAVMFDTRSNR